MYELIRLTEHNYYIECPAKVGVIDIGGGEAVLIDSGSDKDAAKKILRVIEAKGWHLKAIFNTHYHADHVGGNAALTARCGCKIYAPDIECGFIRYPLLEPTVLFGANPPEELRHKFLMAQPSSAEALSDEVLPEGLHILPLGGHSFGMVGFATDEGTVYLADALASEATLEKYKIPYIADVGQYIKTLESVSLMKAEHFVPSHANVCISIEDLARINIDATLAVGDKITDICQEWLTFDELLAKIFVECSLNMTHEQHALVGSTVRAYLTWLRQQGRLTCEVRDKRLVWKRA